MTSEKVSEPAGDPAAGLAVLKKHLDDLADRGTERVWLTEAALDQLAVLRQHARQAGAPAVPGSPTPTPPATNESPAPYRAPDKASRLDALKGQAETCGRCRSLGTLRDTMVFAVGAPDADLMFVGEAPGYEEERQREPFVGPAGQLLTKIIQTMGLQREEVYISNIVKFRPMIGDGERQGTGNRAPTPEEMAASVEYVKGEIEIVEPKVIVALGGTAMAGLLGIDGSVGRARGQLHEFAGVPVIVTYHPSYLLRSGALGEKRKVWEDMLFAMEQLGMPISDKQRGYFLK